jgi:hypothetical protein
MSLLQNITDQVTFGIHKLTYNPEAEQYAASKQAAQEAADAAQRKQDQEATKKGAVVEAENKKLENAKRAADQAAQNEFNMGRFLGKILGIVAIVLLYFLVFAGAIYGAHLATNLNVYRTWSFRVLYAVYGFLFFPLVILYVIGYRYWWNGKKPRFYALLPLIPYFINNPLLAFFFSWMSFKPDAYMDTLQEWNPVLEQQGVAQQLWEEQRELEDRVGI